MIPVGPMWGPRALVVRNYSSSPFLGLGTIVIDTGRLLAAVRSLMIENCHWFS